MIEGRRDAACAKRVEVRKRKRTERETVDTLRYKRDDVCDSLRESKVSIQLLVSNSYSFSISQRYAIFMQTLNDS